jgi:hypothetical protein
LTKRKTGTDYSGREKLVTIEKKLLIEIHIVVMLVRKAFRKLAVKLTEIEWVV